MLDCCWECELVEAAEPAAVALNPRDLSDAHCLKGEVYFQV